jgi:hypothetical protein
MPKTSKPFDFLLVRHAMEKKRGDIDAVSGLIKAPFKSNSLEADKELKLKGTRQVA